MWFVIKTWHKLPRGSGKDGAHAWEPLRKVLKLWSHFEVSKILPIMSRCAESFGSKPGGDIIVLCLELGTNYPGAVEKMGHMHQNHLDRT